MSDTIYVNLDPDIINITMSPNLEIVEVTPVEESIPVDIQDVIYVNKQLEIAEVITGDPGSAAAVEVISQTEKKVSLRVTIPQGLVELQGNAATIEIDSVLAGSPGQAPAVQNLGTPNAAKLKFTLPLADIDHGIEVTDDYNLSVSDKLIYVNGTHPISLFLYPCQDNNDKWLSIKNIGSDIVLILPSGDDLIDDLTVLQIDTGESVDLKIFNSNWRIL